MNEVKIDSNLEIDKALKEFEAKSGEEETQNAPVASKTTELPKMVRLVIKFSGGAIKDQRQAEYVLLGVVVIMLAISFYLFFGGSKSAPVLVPANFGANQQQSIQ